MQSATSPDPKFANGAATGPANGPCRYGTQYHHSDRGVQMNRSARPKPMRTVRPPAPVLHGSDSRFSAGTALDGSRWKSLDRAATANHPAWEEQSDNG